MSMIFGRYANNHAGDCCLWGNGKVDNREMPMIFGRYGNNHAGDCYHMYYGKPDAKDEVLVYTQVALPFEPDDNNKKGWSAYKIRKSCNPPSTIHERNQYGQHKRCA